MSDPAGTDLSGRFALVTGASRGIGRAIALALADAGARLLLLGRDRDALEAAASEARGRAPTVEVVAEDLGDAETAPRVARHVAASGDRLDVLVHAAAHVAHAALGATTLADLDAHLATNLRAPWELTRALLEALVRARGQLVFVNSSIVQFPRAETPAYAASKHALRGLADSLRAELNPRGVRVLSVFPGRTATDGQQRLSELDGRPYRPELLLQAGDVARVVRGCLEMPPTAEITEVFVRPMQKT